MPHNVGNKRGSCPIQSPADSCLPSLSGGCALRKKCRTTSKEGPAQVRVLQTLVCRPSGEGWNSLRGDALASNWVDAPSRPRPPRLADVNFRPLLRRQSRAFAREQSLRGTCSGAFGAYQVPQRLTSKPLDEETENLHKVCACALAPAFRAFARQKSLRGQIPGAIGAFQEPLEAYFRPLFEATERDLLLRYAPVHLHPCNFRSCTRQPGASERHREQLIRTSAAQLAEPVPAPSPRAAAPTCSKHATQAAPSAAASWRGDEENAKKRKRSSMHLFQSPS